MIRLYDFDEVKPEEILNRDIRAEADVEATVDAIIADVRARGDAALIDYAAKFDHAELTSVQVTQQEIDEAFAELEAEDPEFITTLKMAAENIRHFHEQQLHKNFVLTDKPGVVLGQKYTPIQRAGVYVPGGTAAYPSTVLMDVIPAKVAGVKQIVMTTPAGPGGKVNAGILAAAVIAGIDKIFKTGGAQAVAALAYGTESVPAVDKIVGPGNIYVATAKRKVFGKVGIDMIAGPSEILVLADGSCNPAWVAADLLSQAEHDKLATPVLVTDSWDLARAVQAELEVQIPQLPRAAIARASVDTNGKIIVTDDMNKAIEAVNIIAPEHLEICVDDPFAVLNRVENAGSIFLGKNVPEALGDYFAGPNHTLPTSGTARFSSPLGVDDFVKKSSFIYYTREALGQVEQRIANFAEHEGLHAHAKSVTIRFEGEEAGGAAGMSRYFTKTLAALEPYTPGEQLKMDNLVKLNANENPYPPAPGVAAAVAAAVPGLRLYSDLTNAELNRAIAEHWGVQPENVLCGNGSDENLLLALRAFCDEETPLAFADITYSFYPVLCDLLHIPQHVIPLEDDFTIDLRRYHGLHETIVIANPNAPTSLLAPVAAIEEVLRTNPDNIVIVDETYVEFAPEESTCLPLLEKYDNLVITHTFSKTHNLAGARLGFCLARPELIADMNRVKFSYSPYNVNSLTQAAGTAAIRDEGYFRDVTQKVLATRADATHKLRERGFTVLDSATNFLFVTTDRMPCKDIFEQLRKRGILIRYFSAPRIDNWLRITIGTPEQMQRFFAALDEVLPQS